jgi:hypothetical protein
MFALRSTQQSKLRKLNNCTIISCYDLFHHVGYAISTMTSSVEAATALGPVVMLPLLLFGGFFVNNE